MLKFNLMIMVMMTWSLISNKRYSYKIWWNLAASLLITTTLFLPTLTSDKWLISNITSMDQLSQSLSTLSILIASLMMITSTKILHNNMNTAMFSMLNLILLMILINCFTSTNLFYFYILFEASLIPTMFIIMLWGYQPERVQASMYMMIYTVLASLPMLITFILMYNFSLTTNMNLITTPSSFNNLFLLFIIMGFLVKLPMFTVHLWLPKAHVEAPIAGSMILAAILLKLGGYGIVRVINMMTLYNNMFPLLISISLIGAIITSMICLRQPDLKSLIAYSSVGHMGLLLAGLLSNSYWGLTGAILMMIAHGLSSSALFSLANISYEINSTRSMFLMKGMMSFLPTMTMWWFLFSATNMAAPPSLNLLSEITLITAITSISKTSIMFLILITFLAGAYSLHMYSSTQHGQINNFINPTSYIKQKDMLMLLIHMTPLILLVTKSEMLMI